MTRLIRHRFCSCSWLAIFLLALSPAVLAQDVPPFAVVSTVDQPEIAGRAVQLDAAGKLLPFPFAHDVGASYSSHVLTQWTILWDQYNRQRLYYYYCCFDFDRTTFELAPDPNWANSTGYLRAMLQGFVERLYPYTGDARTLAFLRDFVDYELENGTTPAEYAWSQVPYASADPGARSYRGWSSHGVDYIEPHVVGEDGYAYLRLYEMTGDQRYLQAALRCANALVKNVRRGDAEHSPWPVRCFARDGHTGTPAMGEYSANVVEPIMLFDELVRLDLGDVARYKAVRAQVWQWFVQYPLTNNVWVGYFEDVVPSMGNMNQVIPLEFARYVLLNPDKDPEWKQHAARLIDWVKTTPRWPKYVVHGATVTTEQGDGKNFCCNLPNQCCDSHTARLAAVEAFYYVRTGDAAYRDAAFRSYNWVTYFQGLPGGASAPFAKQWWFTDEFADGPRRMMDAFWAVPEWAPRDESHLLGSSSVVTHVQYRRGAVLYSTFDARSEDVLRLDFAPDKVLADGRPLRRVSTLNRNGYVFDEQTRVLRILHTAAHNIEVRGHGGAAPVQTITFDDPHQAATTVLNGEYPAGQIDWGKQQWKIAVPAGKFGTFHVQPVATGAQTLRLQFVAPRVLAGFDAYNASAAELTITLRAEDNPARTVTLQPGEIQRVRTAWQRAAGEVTIEVTDAAGLHVDNLRYQSPRR